MGLSNIIHNLFHNSIRNLFLNKLGTRTDDGKSRMPLIPIVVVALGRQMASFTMGRLHDRPIENEVI